MKQLGPLSTRALGVRSVSVLLVRVAGAGAGFALQVAMARALGADEVGSYALALTVATVSSVFARFGMDTAVLRYAANAHSAGDSAAMAVVNAAILRVVLPATLAVALAGILGADWVSSALFGKPQLAGPLALMLASVPAFAMASVVAEGLRATDRHIAAAAIQGAAIPIVSLVAVLVAGSSLVSAEQMAWIYLVATAVVCGTAAGLWSRARRPLLTGTAAGADGSANLTVGKILGTAFGMYGATLAGILMAWADVLFLGFWATSSEVGVYNAAARTATLVSFVLLAVNSVVAPRFASAALQASLEDTRRLACRAALLTTGATMPVLVVLVLAPERILALFGPEFTAGAAALVIIALGQMVNAVTGPVGHLLNMRALHAIETRISLLAMVLNVLLCIALIPRLGATGAAWAHATAVVVCNVLRAVMVRRLLGIWIYPRL